MHASTIRPRTCRACGQTFPGGPRAHRCPACRRERRRETDRRHQERRRKGLYRPLGSEDFCTVCGAGYTVSSPTQKYCPACAEAAIKAVDTRQGMAYYRAHSAEINPPRNLARRKGPRECVICGRVYETPTCRVTCGAPECKTALRRIYQRRDDAKRRPKRHLTPIIEGVSDE